MRAPLLLRTPAMSRADADRPKIERRELAIEIPRDDGIIHRMR
jgi:hypothetical protein